MTLLPPPARARRRPSLTPMIDVVFLLLVFFMLASRFGGIEALPLPLAGSAPAAAPDAPRLVDVTPGGARLNGVAVAEGALADAVLALGEGRDAIVILRPRDGAPLQRLVDVAAALRAAGFARIAVVE